MEQEHLQTNHSYIHDIGYQKLINTATQQPTNPLHAHPPLLIMPRVYRRQS